MHITPVNLINANMGSTVVNRDQKTTVIPARDPIFPIASLTGKQKVYVFKMVSLCKYMRGGGGGMFNVLSWWEIMGLI